MNWKVKGHGNDLSVYEFRSTEGDEFICKFNAAKGSLRLHYGSHHAVINVEPHNLTHRKFTLANLYGSDIATVTKSMWRENTGTVAYDYYNKAINFTIESRSSTIDVADGINSHACDLTEIPHPGRQEHFMPVLIAMSWLLSVEVKADKLQKVAI